MQNKNYELIRKSRNGQVKILKKSSNFTELLFLKSDYKNNYRNKYEIRPELVYSYKKV